jgi:exoribonuclease R
MILCNKFASLEMKDILSIVRYNNTPKIDLTNINKSVDPKLIEMYVISNNEAASYKINTEYTGHTLLNLDYYTHFSSPLRRYIDLVLHRILYEKINNKEEIYSETELKDICKNVNEITKNYKLAYNIHKLNKIMKDKTTLEIECNLIYIGENIIKLFYKEDNLLLFVNLIHSKIKDSLDININPNELHIKNDCDEIINLKLFQTVKVKIFKLKNSIKPYQISLTEPVLNLI